MVYSYEMDMCFCADDALWAQGWPELPPEVDEFSSAQVKMLVGKGFSLPCIAICHLAFWLNPWGNWWNGDVPEELP